MGENFRPKLPVVSHAGREDVMAQESAPPFPKLLIHQAVNVMKMDCLKRFQKLVSSMKEPRSLLA
jgi:hypothetical protein